MSTNCFEKLCEIWLESYPQVASRPEGGQKSAPLNQKNPLINFINTFHTNT
jgi:hypothetical protein